MKRFPAALAFWIVVPSPGAVQQPAPTAKKVTLIHAGELLDRPGQKPRGNRDAPRCCPQSADSAQFSRLNEQTVWLSQELSWVNEIA